ncbi:hypothetical protein BDW42DRAFT_187416 [Aspergillus taichungensis]|uniref:Uncharacterized protein n=1 Tax=Aspergillus taichungensis TaxID=482145 RepID=A0A2J5HMN9_9EURO|nr:hypothetical protein BDW42DRAFT_187416 [Aspergillus taichungensis]
MSVKNLLRVSIESKQFPGSFLRLDGRGVNEFANSGAGVVNAQTRIGEWETFIIVNHPEDNTVSLLSAAFPNVYLRLDGHDVKSGQKYPRGAGVVNCQLGSHTYEKFRLVDQDDGSKAIASVNFPNVYLRLENEKNEGGNSGGGTVNCQSYIGTMEKFVIRVL